MITKDQIERLSRQKGCPRCNMDKTGGNALCRRCRYKLPLHMRMPLEGILQREESIVGGALRAAANYFEIHYKSILHFGGGAARDEG